MSAYRAEFTRTCDNPPFLAVTSDIGPSQLFGLEGGFGADTGSNTTSVFTQDGEKQ